MPWMDMAHDAGYRGDERRQMAAQLEQEARDEWERKHDESVEFERQLAAEDDGGDVPF